jgi:hypothetical protein
LFGFSAVSLTADPAACGHICVTFYISSVGWGGFRLFFHNGGINYNAAHLYGRASKSSEYNNFLRKIPYCEL